MRILVQDDLSQCLHSPRHTRSNVDRLARDGWRTCTITTDGTESKTVRAHNDAGVIGLIVDRRSREVGIRARILVVVVRIPEIRDELHIRKKVTTHVVIGTDNLLEDI